MKTKKKNIVYLLVVAAFACLVCGCNDSDSSPQSEIVDIQTLGNFPRQAPAKLARATYRLAPSQSTYAAFTLDENSTIGYMIFRGTVEIYDSEGAAVHSDIFFPVDNDYKTVALDAGQYRIKIQNSVEKEGAFTIFSEDMGLDVTTIRQSDSLLVAENTHEFIIVETRRNGVDFTASLPTGEVTLFDFNHEVLAEASGTIGRTLPAGQYILLADNSDSKTYGSLEIDMK
ncbi:MAG: hypothetical protein ACQERN_05650 [Thermodesulfobacteriota bacterium]